MKNQSKIVWHQYLHWRQKAKATHLFISSLFSLEEYKTSVFKAWPDDGNANMKMWTTNLKSTLGIWWVNGRKTEFHRLHSFPAFGRCEWRSNETIGWKTGFPFSITIVRRFSIAGWREKREEGAGWIESWQIFPKLLSVIQQLSPLLCFPRESRRNQ